MGFTMFAGFPYNFRNYCRVFGVLYFIAQAFDADVENNMS